MIQDILKILLIRKVTESIIKNIVDILLTNTNLINCILENYFIFRCKINFPIQIFHFKYAKHIDLNIK